MRRMISDRAAARASKNQFCYRITRHGHCGKTNCESPLNARVVSRNRNRRVRWLVFSRICQNR